MSKESIKAVKDATKYLKELAEAKKDANVSLFQLSTIEVDNDELETTIVQYMDDANHFASHLSAALNEDPDLAHLFGHAIGNLTEESMEAFQEGFIHEKMESETEQITNIALLRASKQLTNEDYFKELDKLKKELKEAGMPEDDIKNHIKLFDDAVTDAMKTIKENFNKD